MRKIAWVPLFLLVTSCGTTPSALTPPPWTGGVLGGPADASLSFDIRALHDDKLLSPLYDRMMRELGDQGRGLEGISRIDVYVRATDPPHLVAILYDAPATPPPNTLQDFSPNGEHVGSETRYAARGEHEPWLTVRGTTWIITSEQPRDFPTPAPADLPSHSILAVWGNVHALDFALAKRRHGEPSEADAHVDEASVLLIGGDTPEIRSHVRFDGPKTADDALAALDKKSKDDDLAAIVLKMMGKLTIDHDGANVDISFKVNPDLVALAAKNRRRHGD